MVELALDVPATYRIRVKGYLDATWSDRLGGMAIRTAGQDEAIFPIYKPYWGGDNHDVPAAALEPEESGVPAAQGMGGPANQEEVSL